MVRRKFQYQNQAPITLGSEDTFEISSPLVAIWERVLCTKCREFARTLTLLKPVKNYHPAHPKGCILKGLASLHGKIGPSLITCRDAEISSRLPTPFYGIL